MSDTATASVGPAPTAIEPSRVLVLNDDEQHLIVETVDSILGPYTTGNGEIRKLAAEDNGVPWHSLRALRNRVAHGDEYDNPADELVRTTLRKRRLETELRRCNQTIERTTETVVEELVDRGDSGGKHAATGASYRIDRKIWAKVVKADEKVTPEEKHAAAVALVAADLGDFVREDFNTNTVSAYFREQIKEWDAAQRALPEHERTPRAAAEFLPPELVGFIELDDTPTIQVRAS